MRRIALSTCTLARATFRVQTTSLRLICFSPAMRNGGMYSLTPAGRRSCTLNPLSTITASPHSNMSSTSLSATMARSLVLPPYSCLASDRITWSCRRGVDRDLEFGSRRAAFSPSHWKALQAPHGYG
ncbi:hypothetical protein ISCGN_013569 [Ixodes scapularis]